MDMPVSSDTSSSQMPMEMIPWLHFRGGDYLIFRQWRPNSHGAIAGACIGLAALAILERWVYAMRRIMDTHWKRRALGTISGHSQDSVSNSGKALEETTTGAINCCDETIDQSLPLVSTRTLRLIPPFNLAHDLPRGIIFAFQALFSYVLMLAAMTFHAGYVISIVLGLGIGEMFFGRMGNGEHVH